MLVSAVQQSESARDVFIMSCFLAWADSLQNGSISHCGLVDYNDNFVFCPFKIKLNGKEKLNKMTKEMEGQINEDGEQCDL